MLHPSDHFGDPLHFGIRIYFKVAVWTDLIDVINAVKSASLLTQLVNGGETAGQHWCREEPSIVHEELGCWDFIQQHHGL